MDERYWQEFFDSKDQVLKWFFSGKPGERTYVFMLITLRSIGSGIIHQKIDRPKYGHHQDCNWEFSSLSNDNGQLILYSSDGKKVVFSINHDNSLKMDWKLQNPQDLPIIFESIKDWFKRYPWYEKPFDFEITSREKI